MKEYIRINITFSVIGGIVGVIIWAVFTICEPDPNEYNKFVYYTNAQGEIKRAIISTNRKELHIIVDYYNSGCTILTEDRGNFFIVPLDNKAMIIDTLDKNTLKVKILYTDRYGDLVTKKGYSPNILIHDVSPIELEK